MRAKRLGRTTAHDVAPLAQVAQEADLSRAQEPEHQRKSGQKAQDENQTPSELDSD